MYERTPNLKKSSGISKTKRRKVRTSESYGGDQGSRNPPGKMKKALEKKGERKGKEDRRSHGGNKGLIVLRIRFTRTGGSFVKIKKGGPRRWKGGFGSPSV